MDIDKNLIGYRASLYENGAKGSALADTGMLEHLDESADETFRRLGILSEMAMPLKEYQVIASDLRFQIVEDWCLCKYCQLFNPQCETFGHWKKELGSFIRKLRFIGIKNGADKGKTLRRVWISKCDLKKRGMVLSIIEDKFDGEGIDDVGQRNAVSLAFADSVEGLIDCISNDATAPDSYIQAAFGGSAAPENKPTHGKKTGKPKGT